jgi:hypothetical protein
VGVRERGVTEAGKKIKMYKGCMNKTTTCLEETKEVFFFFLFALHKLVTLSLLASEGSSNVAQVLLESPLVE